MIEQSILPSISAKASGTKAEAGLEAGSQSTDKKSDFSAIMLAQQELEGELLGADLSLRAALDTAEPATALVGSGTPLPESGKPLPEGSKAAAQSGTALPDSSLLPIADGNLSPESGKPLPESGKALPGGKGETAQAAAAPSENAAAPSEDTAEPTGLAALAKLPELPSYRDIAILPPPGGTRIRAQAQTQTQTQAQAQAQAQTQAQAQPQGEAPRPQAPQAPIHVPKTAPPAGEAAPATTAEKAPATPQPLRASDLQLAVTKAPGFSQVLQDKAPTTSIAEPAALKETASGKEPAALKDVPAKPRPHVALGAGANAAIEKGDKATPQNPASALAQAATAPATATATPIAAPTQSAATAPVPTAPQAQAPSPQAIETLVERLVQARDQAQPGTARLSVANSDFGTVALRFDNGAAGLSVSMTNADPEFAMTARAALAERVVMAGDTVRSEFGQGRGDQSGQQSSQGQTSAQSQGQSQGQAQTQSQHNGQSPQDRFQPHAANGTSAQSSARHSGAEAPTKPTNPADSGLYI